MHILKSASPYNKAISVIDWRPGPCPDWERRHWRQIGVKDRPETFTRFPEVRKLPSRVAR